jgi:hypothetical protein
MISNGITYQVGLARMADLRHEADERRRAGVVRRAADRARSIGGRGHHRGQLRDALAVLSSRRPARA